MVRILDLLKKVFNSEDTAISQIREEDIKAFSYYSKVLDLAKDIYTKNPDKSIEECISLAETFINTTKNFVKTGKLW